MQSPTKQDFSVHVALTWQKKLEKISRSSDKYIVVSPDTGRYTHTTGMSTGTNFLKA